MRKDIADRWIAALTSGEYKQGRGGLCTVMRWDGVEENHFCCLGVLTDLYLRETGGEWTEPRFKSDYSIEARRGVMLSGAYGYHVEKNGLPGVVQEWSGMRSEFGSYTSTEGYYDDTFIALSAGQLSSDNDTGASFAKIADIIREHYEEM